VALEPCRYNSPRWPGVARSTPVAREEAVSIALDSLDNQSPPCPPSEDGLGGLVDDDHLLNSRNEKSRPKAARVVWCWVGRSETDRQKFYFCHDAINPLRVGVPSGSDAVAWRDMHDKRLIRSRVACEGSKVRLGGR
jgi:hypothetical protein